VNSARLFFAAAGSLARHKLRTSLSALGIVFGVMALVSMLAVAEGAKQETLEQVEALGAESLILRTTTMTETQALVASEGHSRGLTLEDANRIVQGVPRVERVAPVVEVRAELANLTGVSAPEVLAVTDDYFAVKKLTVIEGRALCQLDVEARNLVCVLGAGVARDLSFNGRPGATVRIGEELFEVVGVLARRGWRAAKDPALSTRNLDAAVFIPLGVETALVSPLAEGPRQLDEIIVRMGSTADVVRAAPIVSRILESTRTSTVDHQVVVPHELLRQAQRSRRVFNLVLSSVAAISLLVGGIGIMNILLASVSERTREIGIRRAIGANRGQIAIHFLFESAILSSCGATLGVGAGALTAATIARLAEWNTLVTPWGVILAVCMAAGVGLSAGLYPAWRAARLDPIAALRVG